MDLRGQGQPVSRATTVVPDTEDCLLCAFVLTGVPSHYSAALVGYLYAAAFDHLTTRVSGPAIYFTSIRAPPSV